MVYFPSHSGLAVFMKVLICGLNSLFSIHFGLVTLAKVHVIVYFPSRFGLKLYFLDYDTVIAYSPSHFGFVTLKK